MIRIALAVFIALHLLCSLPAMATEPDVLRYHTGSWEGITNKDGTGLYHEIIKRIFTKENIYLEVSYLPVKRALMNVSSGAADMTGASNKADPGQVRATHPIWISQSSAMFDKTHLSFWKGYETIKRFENRTVSSYGMGRHIGANIHEVSTRNQALQMLLDGRMDYYADDKETLTSLLRGNTEIIGFEEHQADASVDFDRSKYVIRTIAENTAYMVFSNTERGRRYRDIFDKGFYALFQSGELRKLYKKWDLEAIMPRTLAE